MPKQAHLDVIEDGYGNIIYPKTVEKAIFDDNGVSLHSKLSMLGAVVDCTCTHSESNKIYILEPINLQADLPQIFSVRFVAPNDYVAGSTFSLKNVIYTPKMVNSAEIVPTKAFTTQSLVMLDFCQSPGNYAYFSGYNFPNNSGSHNSIYRGLSLGSSVTPEQWAAIAAGTFDDLFIGDYWTINSVNYRIAAFDYYLNTGNINTTKHHMVIVPDRILYSYKMNDTNTTVGGYIGSKMYTEGLNQAKETINTAFGSAHILNHKQRLSNAVTNGYTSGSIWEYSTVELMTERNVYGNAVYSNVINGTNMPYNYTIDKGQFPLFFFRHDLICIRNSYWLRDVASGSTFACVTNLGYASCGDASGSIGVRPAFSIC